MSAPTGIVIRSSERNAVWFNELRPLIKLHSINNTPEHSMGKRLVSYVTGYAICEVYIHNINVKLDDWSTVKGTL